MTARCYSVPCTLDADDEEEDCLDELDVLVNAAGGDSVMGCSWEQSCWGWMTTTNRKTGCSGVDEGVLDEQVALALAA